jgi:hypothetical protein
MRQIHSAVFWKKSSILKIFKKSLAKHRIGEAKRKIYVTFAILCFASSIFCFAKDFFKIFKIEGIFRNTAL